MPFTADAFLDVYVRSENSARPLIVWLDGFAYPRMPTCHRPHLFEGDVMETLTIPPEQWTSRLNKLSQSFEGWLVSLDVIARGDGHLREFHQIPLLGITAEPDGPIVISVAEVTGEHVTHIIHSPTRVLLDRTDAGANAALEIESADGMKAVLRFRSEEAQH